MHRWWRWTLLALGIAAFIVQCYGLYGPPGPPSDSTLPIDKIAHLGGFAVPVALFVGARVSIGWVCGLAVVQAVASELVQWRFLPQRSGDPLDLLADLLGIGIGVLVGLLLRRMARRARSVSDPAPDRSTP
ncbi:MAG TPA: VanZ family protein [Candidatus Avipropionibacterium avicola]|uniref:VanZ family protein n=1 Tax=Candidatus Avipropionibacterium avicola TaxID=2840701 RepID=A0A9D1GW19_9ACTN|nr:VanZ family protein [Candidatus Avipropionibacterium avicola]